VDRLYATGDLTRLSAAAFGEGAAHFPDVAELVASVKNDIHDNVTLLVKGSRSMRMERVVQSLLAAGY
jgi:UDP-N-acetylmuramoyl-tripeptide--D-alanyl-D-alanine ligase